jgi:uncharacterized protein YkwD
MMDYLGDLLHTFIPNPGNDYKPHFFRIKSIVVIATVIAVLFGASLGLQTLLLKNHDYLAAVITAALVDLANSDRTANGLENLAINPILQRAAELKAADMAQKSYFAHTSPEGVSPWHWFKEAGYSFSYAGENLAVRFSDSVDVERAWMNSPTHRANIMNSSFSEIGIATAEGTYQGQPTIFVVQMFGRPAVPVVVEKAEPAATTTPVTPKKNVVVLVTEPKSASTSTSVAGASFEELTSQTMPEPKIIMEDPTFIAVKNEIATVSPLASVASSNVSYSFIQKAMTSPRTMMTSIYLVIAGIIALALSLMIGIEVKRQYPFNVFMGVLLIVMMAAILFLWQTIPPGTLTII